MEENQKQHCVNCGNSFEGKYCNICGERIVKREELTVRHLIGETIKALTFADSKIFRTLKTLFFKPGVLPKRYLEGYRKAFVPPLSLFLLVNLIYFLLNPFDTLNSHLNSQLAYQPYSELIYDYGVQQMESSTWSNEVYTEKYNARSLAISKSMILIFPLLFSFPLWLLFYRKTRYLFDHLMLALSYMTFILLGLLLLMPALIKGILYLMAQLGQSVQFDWNGLLATVLLFGLIGLYLFFTLKHFYKQTNGATLLKTVVLIPAFVGVLFAYRFILFFVTVWSL